MPLNRKIKRLAFVLSLIVLTGYMGYKFTYQPHVTIQSKAVDFKGSASALLLELNTAPEKWTNKIVDISGKVSQSDSLGFMLESNIYCQKNQEFITPQSSILNSTLRIKGRIIGYDDLLEELKLDQVILLNQ